MSAMNTVIIIGRIDLISNRLLYSLSFIAMACSLFGGGHLPTSDGLKISIDELDIFMDYNVHRFANGYLVWSRQGTSLSYVYKNEIVSSFSKKGLGPQELNYPTVLGIEKSHILLLTGNGTLLRLNRQLEIVDEFMIRQVEGLNQFVYMGGNSINADRFQCLTAPVSRSNFQIQEFQIEKDHVLLVDQMFPQKKYDPSTMPAISVFFRNTGNIHGRFFFKMNAVVFWEKDFFDFEIYELDQNNQYSYTGTVHVPLTNELRQIKVSEMTIRCFPKHVYLTDSGYLVTLNGCVIPGSKDRVLFGVFVDKKGKYTSTTKLNIEPISCWNSNETFGLVEIDNKLMLTNIHLSSYTSVP